MDTHFKLQPQQSKYKHFQPICSFLFKIYIFFMIRAQLFQLTVADFQHICETSDLPIYI